jgi:multisubunit Na+/H+ antiporter MnhF subunit
MNEWELAACVLAVALVPCLAICWRRSPTHGLVAFEVAGTLMTTILMLLSEGFHRQPFIDLALALALLAPVGAIAFARLMERDI